MQVCRYLRTKSLYIGNTEGTRVLVEPSETAVYWCNRTGGSMGPDHDIAGPQECDGSRSCYLGVPLVLTDGPTE